MIKKKIDKQQIKQWLVERHAESIDMEKNAFGWIRLCEILWDAKQDKEIADNVEASKFLEYLIKQVDEICIEQAKTLEDAVSIMQPHKRTHMKRLKAFAKREFIQFVRNLYPTLNPKPCSMSEWEELEEIKPYKKAHYGENTLRNWINEALPNTLKKGRPKKK